MKVTADISWKDYCKFIFSNRSCVMWKDVEGYNRIVRTYIMPNLTIVRLIRDYRFGEKVYTLEKEDER